MMICGCIFLYQLAHKVPLAKTAEVSANVVAMEGNGQEDYVNNRHLSNFVVVLDAGHGGDDSGTLYGSLYEKDISLSVAEKIKRNLENYGATVILTRDSDVYVDLEKRVELANTSDADLLISIHCNYFEKDANISGLECYYAKDNNAGRMFADAIASEIDKSGITKTRGAREQNYYVIRKAAIPAVLIELGYLSNASERDKLNNQDYQKVLADEIAKGIHEQLKAEETENANKQSYL